MLIHYKIMIQEIFINQMHLTNYKLLYSKILENEKVNFYNMLAR